jgi:putative endonuclease
MYYTYILESQKDGGWYIGFTSDLKRRLQDHNSGQSKSTKSRVHFKLIYYEAYIDKRDAEGRERFLKSGLGRNYIKKQLSNYLSQ